MVYSLVFMGSAPSPNKQHVKQNARSVFLAVFKKWILFKPFCTEYILFFFSNRLIGRVLLQTRLIWSFTDEVLFFVFSELHSFPNTSISFCVDGFSVCVVKILPHLFLVAYNGFFCYLAQVIADLFHTMRKVLHCSSSQYFFTIPILSIQGVQCFSFYHNIHKLA